MRIVIVFNAEKGFYAWEVEIERQLRELKRLYPLPLPSMKKYIGGLKIHLNLEVWTDDHVVYELSKKSGITTMKLSDIGTKYVWPEYRVKLFMKQFTESINGRKQTR